MPTSSQPQLTDPQALSLDLYAQLLQARDRLDDLLPIAERACTNAEALTISTLQGTDADPRPLMLDLTHLQSHLDGLTLNVSRAATLQTALCVEQATIPAHTPPRPLNQGADALIPLTEAITTLRPATPHTNPPPASAHRHRPRPAARAAHEPSRQARRAPDRP